MTADRIGRRVRRGGLDMLRRCWFVEKFRDSSRTCWVAYGDLRERGGTYVQSCSDLALAS